MKDVSRQEFEDLVKQVRSLERQVDEQQKQIATLKRRTTTDAGSTSGQSSSSDTSEVPVSRIKLDLIEILRNESADQNPVGVESVKTEAAKLDHLRSSANSVIRKWLQKGYLSGDLEAKIQVEEWPPETKPASE